MSPQLKVEIPYVSYDDRSRCYYYGIQVLNEDSKKHSSIKRRRFSEFLSLQGQNPTYSSYNLPSKYFSSSPESRKPRLEKFLNELVQYELINERKLSKTLEKFLGLDNPEPFGSPTLTFEEFEKQNGNFLEQTKDQLSLFVIVMTSLGMLVYNISGRYFSAPQALLLTCLHFLVCIGFILFNLRRERERRRKDFRIAQQAKETKIKLEKHPIDDFSISKAEAENIPKLRLRLLDFASGTTPEYDADFMATYKSVISGITGVKEPILDQKDREIVWDTNVLEDHRIVLFLRVNGNNLDKAESHARFALTTRVALKSDSLHSLGWTPPKPVVKYTASPLLVKYTQDVDLQRKERIDNWWLRDKEGCLCSFTRLGYVATGKLFEFGLGRNDFVMNKSVNYFVEMFRKDMDMVHKETKGKSQAYCTVVIDMEGFDLSEQLSASDVIAFSKKFNPLISPGQVGILKRVIVINAPWYVSVLLNLIKPFVPKDILDTIRIHSGCNVDTAIRPFIEDKYIPKYLGGQLVGENGDIYCRDRLAPYGPFEPDKGMKILTGKE